jgi:hypothetical protein
MCGAFLLGRKGNDPMSDLAQRVAALKRKPKLEEWLASLDPDDRAAIEKAAREVKPNTLEVFIRDEGVQVSDVSLGRWIASLDSE